MTQKAEGELLTSFDSLTSCIDSIFADTNIITEDEKRANLIDCVNRFRAPSHEVEQYALFDTSKPYTRNLIATNSNYSLLLLCWNPAQASKVHDHPCNACILMPLSGTLKEERYQYDGENVSDAKPSVKFFLEGQVSYMNNDLGLHRIINPRKNVNSISLHLYYPPFASCSVWSQSPVDNNSFLNREQVSIGFFSRRGIRTPALEGRQSIHGMVMIELLSKTSFRKTS